MPSERIERHSRSHHRSSRSRHSVSPRRESKRSRRSYSRSPSRSYSSDEKRKGSHRRRKRTKHRRHRRSYSRSSGSSDSSASSRSRASSVESSHSEEGLTPAELESKRELERLTRDARTVFVSQLQVKVTERDIKKFFERVCKVKDVVLIKDRFTNRSKGYGYVELKSLEDVPLALNLTGQKFVFPNGKEGFPVLIKPSEAEKNFTHFLEKKANTANVTYNGRSDNGRRNMRKNPVLKEPWDDKIEVKNLPSNITKDQVLDLCKKFGTVLDLDLIIDHHRNNSQCFVHFKHRGDARQAYRDLEGMELSGYRLKVYKMQKGQVSRIKGTTQDDVDRLSGDGIFGNNDPNAWKLEADTIDAGRYGGSGVAMNASMKMSLMSKLAGGTGNELFEQSKAIVDERKKAREDKREVDQGPGRVSGTASKCLLIKNLFDPAEETEPDWDKQIEEELKLEANRFGKVNHIFVDHNSMGNVYLCMNNVQGGVECATAMHGRYFDKRMLIVEYINPEAYVKQFPESKAY